MGYDFLIGFSSDIGCSQYYEGGVVVDVGSVIGGDGIVFFEGWFYFGQGFYCCVGFDVFVGVEYYFVFVGLFDDWEDL